jgi:uroporphyrinogen-III synthase
MSLQGKRVVNTRAAHQAGELDVVLRRRGAIPLSFPCIAIVPPDDTEELEAALSGKYDLLVLTSVNAVLSLASLDVSLTHLPAAVVGEATAEAAQEMLGVEISLIPEEYSADALADELDIFEGMRVLLPQSEIARPVLAEALRKRGVEVTAITAYRTVRGSGGVDAAGMLKRGEIDAVAFTSPSTVINFVARVGFVPDVPVASIGGQTSQATQELGFTAIVEAEKHTVEGMVAALAAYFEEHE